MNKVIDFVKASVDEMKTKVTWPDYVSLQKSSFLVLIASLIFALVIGLVDLGFENALKWIYKAF